LKYLILFFFFPALSLAQDIDSAEVTHLPAENSYECIDNIYDNPEAVKMLLHKLINDKERFREIFRQIVNDPRMKNIIREIRDVFREDRGVIDSKKSTDINKNNNEMTWKGESQGD
jgi:hypothetical protein